MDLTFAEIYDECDKRFFDHTVNLENCTWLDPWVIGSACLKAIEYKNQPDKMIILPKEKDMKSYLKRMHFDSLLREITYKDFIKPLENIRINERENLNVQEIMHCKFRDEFEARLSSRIRLMFQKFGLTSDDENRATALVGELGNNVFDHNDGQWPTDVRGAIILAQHNPRKRQIEVVVADPGIGFSGSLKSVKKAIKNDVEAIQLGLSGVTGRIGELRGNGLTVIQDWTINKFNGIVRIHSGNGLVVVDKDGPKSETVFPILGTLASFMLIYK